MEECKFKKTATTSGCEGGHTTAQHHMNVFERLIKDVCGIHAYYDIKIAVDRDAEVQTTPSDKVYRRIEGRE